MIKAKKSLGQNFLIDTGVAARIVDAVAPLPDQLLIEIGPGTGALTRLLIERGAHVVAIEIDHRLAQYLRTSLAGTSLSVVQGDALEINWTELVAKAGEHFQYPADVEPFRRRGRVVANLPYYISTPIIERLIRARGVISDMTLMLQSEVVDRIVSEPGGREYGYLSVLIQFYCLARKLFDVPPAAFKPAPKVSSAVVSLIVRSTPAIEVGDEDRFFALIRAAFAQRRKTIANNLKAASGVLPLTGLPEDAFEEAGIDPRRRAETLSISEFGSLYKALQIGSSLRS